MQTPHNHKGTNPTDDKKKVRLTKSSMMMDEHEPFSICLYLRTGNGPSHVSTIPFSFHTLCYFKHLSNYEQ